MPMNRDTYERGKKLRWELIGADIMDRIYAGNDTLTEAQQEYVTEFAWGELFSRPGLPAKTRILLNVVMLGVMGERQVLKYHLGAAVRLGCSKIEIREALLQINAIAGMTLASLALNVAQELFIELAEKKRQASAKKGGKRAKRGAASMARGAKAISKTGRRKGNPKPATDVPEEIVARAPRATSRTRTKVRTVRRR